MAYTDDALLPLSGLQHAAFCERQWALIHIEQMWSENSDTVRGKLFHEHVDAEGYSSQHGVIAERRVRLVSYSLGLYGVADIVERRRNGYPSVMPVEYKVGRPKVEDWDRLQVTAQAMCLEEMEGNPIAVGALFYGRTRRRELVELTNDLREQVVSLSERIHELSFSGVTPSPPANARCTCCSIKDDCLPKVGQLDAHKYWTGFGMDLGVVQ